MSRAFTKEIDDAPPPPLEARAISAAPNYVTARGAGLIEAEADRLTSALAAATPTEVATIQRDLHYWLARRQSMQVITSVASPVAVRFGTAVTIKRGGKAMALQIVGEDEADPAAGLIAWTSPLALSLDGAEAGELIEFSPGGRVEMIEVMSVSAG